LQQFENFVLDQPDDDALEDVHEQIDKDLGQPVESEAQTADVDVDAAEIFLNFRVFEIIANFFSFLYPTSAMLKSSSTRVARPVFRSMIMVKARRVSLMTPTASPVGPKSMKVASKK
jgi:hypothetical protein